MSSAPRRPPRGSFRCRDSRSSACRQPLVEPCSPVPKAVAASDAGNAGRIPYMKRLKAAIETPSAQTQAALLITVDHFRDLEARLGFADSEEILLKLMAWLRQHLNASDVVGRVSSDELALIVARPAVADIDTLCQRHAGL